MDSFTNDTLNLRIQRLRKGKGLTQAELAAKLNITDKAVSKWESGDGNPDISLLPELAGIFGVTIDYLLTGKKTEEKFIPISPMEYCAKEDDVGKAKEYVGTSRTDEKNKGIFQYVCQYESCKIFSAFGDQLLQGDHRGVRDSDFEEFLYMAILSNSLNYIEKVCPLVISDIDGIQGICSKYYTDKIIKALLHDERVSKETKETIIVPLNKTPWKAPLDWQLIYGKMLVWLIHNSTDEEVNAFLDYIEGVNEINITLHKEKEKESDDESLCFVYSYEEGFRYNREAVLVPVIAIEVETIEEVVKNKKIAIAKQMNSINKKINASIFNEHTLNVEETKEKENASKEDINKALVIYDGIVDIEALIKLDDFDFYYSIIHEYPASELEIAYSAFLKKDYRRVLQFGMKYCRNIVEALQKKNEEMLKAAFNAIVLSSVRVGEKTIYDDRSLMALFNNNAINYSYFIKRKQMTSWDQSSIEKAKDIEDFFKKKYVVYFDSILDNSDPRFFKEALKGDKTNIDYVLEKIVSKYPERYEIQKILLDAGAMLHHRWVENNGDEYEEGFDQPDPVATQLLKNQIEVLMQKGK
jgi:transcriptional regulator with XRE-family HTH domain